MLAKLNYTDIIIQACGLRFKQMITIPFVHCRKLKILLLIFLCCTDPG